MLVLAATLAVLAYGLMSPILGVLLPTYSLSSDQQGWLALAQALGLVVASLSAGPVIDVKGVKPALSVGLTLIIIALVSAPNAGGYRGQVIVYLVLGVGGGMVVTGANALAGAIHPSRRGPARRGSALNFLNLFFGLGGIVTTYLASKAIDPGTLCYSIAALTALALATSIAAAMPSPSGEIGFQLKDVPAVISRPQLQLLSLFLFLYVACEVGVWNWLKTYLLTRHFDAATAGRVVSYGFAFGILVGRIVVSRLIIRVPALTITLFASVFIAITTYAMLTLQSPTAITVAVFCAGLSMAPVFPTTLAIIGDTFHRGTATAMGVAITCGWLGLAVSSPIIGALANGDNYHRALMLLPLLSVLMILVSLALRAGPRSAVTV